MIGFLGGSDLAKITEQLAPQGQDGAYLTSRRNPGTRLDLTLVEKSERYRRLSIC